MINVQSAVIAHPYPLDRLALSQIINQQNPKIKIIEVSSFSELQNQLDHHHNINLLLLDLTLLQGSSLQPLTDLCTNHPALKTITISHHRKNISCQGVTGNISSKDSIQTVIDVLLKVAQGKCWFPVRYARAGTIDTVHSQVFCELTRQERRIMDKLVKGLKNKQIANELKISPNTAKVHVSSILRKFGVSNRTQAVLANRQQMIKEPAIKSCSKVS